MGERIHQGAAPPGPEPSQVEPGKPLLPGGTLKWNLPPSSKRAFGNYAGAFDAEAAPCDGSPEGSETRSDEATRYAERLALALWEKHWKTDAPLWRPLTGDLVGILTQIDNMTAGLVRSEKAQGDG